MRSKPWAVVIGALWMMTAALPVSASSDAAVRWTTMPESSQCGDPYIGMPIVSRSGILPDSELILGPVGGYFGRSIDAIRDELVWWTVPMSSGRRVLVHRRALAAFEQVTANLAAEAAAGRSYAITSAAAFVPRSIGGAYQLSRHALGTAIDINPGQNPYSSDPDRWTTNMPEWFIDAWRDAGFCWGGDWADTKDPMHFSWSGAPDGMDPFPPMGQPTDFRQAIAYETPWPVVGTAVLADAGGFGAVDVAAARAHDSGTVIDVVSSRSGFDACSHYRWMTPTPYDSGALTDMGDVDGDSRSDLVTLAPDGTISVSTRRSGFDTTATVSSGVVNAVAMAIGDFDGDRVGDLFVIGSDGVMSVFAGPGLTDILQVSDLGATPSHVAFGDRDGDTTGELFLFDSETVRVMRVAGSGWDESESFSVPVDDAVAVAVADEDGDGRGDVVVLRSDGTLLVVVGNGSTGRSVDSWWRNPGYDCPDDPLPLSWDGRFYDDDGSIFQSDIEALAATEVTRGCNPPFEDAFCPDERVTRGQMAAFLVRAFGLQRSDAPDVFSDDDESIFEDDINALAAAGVTQGCDDGRFCPDEAVTRGQMAAFLVRAFGLQRSDAPDVFSDDDESIFEGDINALAAAGITRGCNPPAADRYCPTGTVTRGQMAAFLTRARTLQ